MKNLTNRQQKFFDFIKKAANEKGQPPSLSEIAEEFGVSPPGVLSQLNALEAKGYIEREPRKARGIKILQ